MSCKFGTAQKGIVNEPAKFEWKKRPQDDERVAAESAGRSTTTCQTNKFLHAVYAKVWVVACRLKKCDTVFNKQLTFL